MSLNNIPALIEKTFPIPRRFKSALPSDIRELSKLLTNNRGERPLSYLGRPNYLSAYLHYFLPWNLYRLCILLPSLNLNLSAGDKITDLGCGPLTFTSALWITRPDLRKIPLEFYCIDRTASVLEAGKKFFTALNSTGSPWTIHLINKDINIKQPKSIHHDETNKSSLVCAINFFNELYENIPHYNTGELQRLAKRAALFMYNEAAKDASILIVEPGIPQSGRFISLLRSASMDLGHHPASPCTHTEACPCAASLPHGQKKKWCHFAFEAANIPKSLQRLSAAAKLPKERLVFSFLLMTAAASKSTQQGIRIISDAFSLPDDLYGRYGCCAQGLVLLSGKKARIDELESFSFIKQSDLILTNNIDKKSGALIMELK
ncbi:MAG: small ribosomal subunit Rsm22 family protein [Treponema sp.]|jgi:ribosomal protein RSM22 (predicted rRNA methylase)|nr:small ribosomal subunit Rsm22 family protein [Treponema sp.]